MKLIFIAACVAVCQAAKLNRGYLPPPESAATAGGNGDILQTPFRSQGLDKSLPTGLPAGSYVNEFEGVVIDADSAGTRATHSGLGNPRENYGSTDSKVGAAAFRESNLNPNKQGSPKPANRVQDETARPGQFGHVNHHSVLPNVAGVRQPVLKPGESRIPVLEAERFHAARDRTSNIIAYQNDIGITDFNYAFHTDNGISAAEAGMALDGVRSKGGYSYTGDDGQVYTISYTADEAGYRPQGSHIPTPPPIPAEILKALEQNAKDEAAGIIDDGSYDAKKYNTDYTKGNRPNDTFERRPVFSVISTINQNSHANKPNQDNLNNGQNQFPDANLGYTVNDKLISNFSNIRNQYENEFDILTNNKFNNNGPVSNFQELSQTEQLSNDSKNQSQNIPLSQQKLQDKNDVSDSLSGRPNSYQAPIASIQNQASLLNNQGALQKPTEAQLKPSFRPPNNSFEKQKITSIQGQQNGINFLNTFNENQQTQPLFNSGISSSQFNTNSQTAGTPLNNLISQTYNNQANVFSRPPVPPTRPSSYEATINPGLNQNQKPVFNVSNVFSKPTQNIPASYYSSSTGTLYNQQTIDNINNVGKIQKHQPIAISGSYSSNPIQTQTRPSSYDATIKGTIEKQPINNSGNSYSNTNPYQVRPNSYYDSSISGTIQNHQSISNLENVFSNPNFTQTRQTLYEVITSGNNIKQQSISNSYNTFPKPTTTQPRPTLITSNKEITATDNNSPQLQITYQTKPESLSPSLQLNLGYNNGFANSGQSTNKQYEDEVYEYPKLDKNLGNVNIASVTNIQQQNPSVLNSYQIQSNTSSFGTVQQQKNQLFSGNLNQDNNKLNANQQNQVTFSQDVISAQSINDNSQQSVTKNNGATINSNSERTTYQGGVFSKPTQVKTDSHDLSTQQQSHLNQADANILQNNVNSNKQNQETFSTGVISAQVLNKDSNSAISNFASPTINSHNYAFDSNVKTKDNPNSQNTVIGGVIHRQQSYNIEPTINQFQNGENIKQPNQPTFNLGDSQYTGTNLQPTTENNTNAYNSDSVSQLFPHIPAVFNSENLFNQQNVDAHLKPLSFTFNNENVDKNDHRLVAISSSQNHNDNSQLTFLHKKFAIRRQQQINQQAFSDFLNSKNVANAPVLISSNFNYQHPTAQPAFENSDINLNNNANFGLSSQQLLSSSQLNQPNPTSQTFGVPVSSDNFITAIPSRTLSTPKDDKVVESQGTSGITQASISPFPLFTQSNAKEPGTINSVFQKINLPSKAIGSSLAVNTEENQSQQANFGIDGLSKNSQNQGEIYNYPKPDQNLPVSTKTENHSQNNFDNVLVGNNNNNIQNTAVETPVPNEIFESISTTTQGLSQDKSNFEFVNGPKLLPSRPNFISNSCCFFSQNEGDQNKSNESNTGNSFHANEEFEGPKTQQSYDETGYHY